MSVGSQNASSAASVRLFDASVTSFCITAIEYNVNRASEATWPSLSPT